jgi:1-deoxy-D-xylulose 5-phosphate reductoisomerase
VQVHKRDAQEDVDVYVCMEDSGKTCGLAVIATQPREFTVVSIVGSIDIDKLAELEGEFGIPKVSQNSESVEK